MNYQATKVHHDKNISHQFSLVQNIMRKQKIKVFALILAHIAALIPLVMKLLV